VVEMAGMQLDAEGRPVHTPLSERMIGIEPERLARVPEIVAIAYGEEKVAGVRAAVRGGLMTTLITHAPLARALLQAD
jgi:DNA-binding transcriptional regulator LsrR (DeoR family)